MLVGKVLKSVNFVSKQHEIVIFSSFSSYVEFPYMPSPFALPCMWERIPVSLLLPLPPSSLFPGEDEHEKKEERGKERGIGLASLRRRSRWGGSIVLCAYILSTKPRAQGDKWRDFPPPRIHKEQERIQTSKNFILSMSRKKYTVFRFFPPSFSLSQKDQGGVGRRNMSSVRHLDKNSASSFGTLGVWGIKTAEKELSPHFLLFS